MATLTMFPRLCRRRFNPTKASKWSSYSRFLSSTPSPDNEDGEKKKDAKALFADSSLRGVGQVIFLNSPTSGMMILGGLAVGDPYLSVLAATGAATATASAHVSGLDKSALRDGLWGYNGCLVGCAAAVFINPIPVAASAATTAGAISAGLATTLVGSAATPFVAAALKPALGSVPQFTLAFNLVTLSTLFRTRPLLPPPAVEAETSEAAVETAAASMPGFSDAILYGPLKGISQIFVVESSLTGAAILGGIAMYSRGLAGHILMGSTIGATTGLLLGADFSSVSIGLWGFNPALTSLGIGVFYVHSPQVVALSAGGAAATAAVFGAMSTVFGTYGSPCLTLPFCFVMSGCYLMADTLPGLTLAQAPHSPEQNG